MPAMGQDYRLADTSKPGSVKREALEHMRKLIAFFALSIFVFGCGERAGQPRLEPLARGLAEARQPVARDLKLEIHAENNGEAVTMHCDLKNVAVGKSQP
jgi:hypothetical protein